MLRHSVRAAVLALAAAALFALAAPATAGASTVTQINLNAANALTVQAPPISTMHLAMVHGAVYDAVNAIDGGFEPYLVSPPAAPDASADAAAAWAAYRMLSHLLPAQESTFLGQYNALVTGIPAAARDHGAAVGDAAANAMITKRTNDGRFGTPGFPLPSVFLPGDWRPLPPTFTNDPNAWVRDVKPFLIKDPKNFGSPGPWPLRSFQYAREFIEVKSVGRATLSTRTDDQTDAALYWMENPPRTWTRIFRTLDTDHGLSVADAARYYAMLYLTASDAFIAVWTDKARHSFWRPVTAIQLAATDGNPATEPDGAWSSLVPNPPYPDHPSGHAGLSGSIVATLQDFFGTDELSWTDTNVAGLDRSFDRASDAIAEIIDARVWSGIHFRKADEDGARIGQDVAKWRRHHYFKEAH